MSEERRNIKRKSFAYYMRVTDDSNQQLIGYLADISTRGFKLDAKQPLEVNQDYNLRLELTTEISEKPYIAFEAHCKWCTPDFTTPLVHNAGFHITSISPDDDHIYQQIVAKYGSQDSNW